jgi:hypothetical protein
MGSSAPLPSTTAPHCVRTSNGAIEALGTLLAIVGRMLGAALGGIAHLAAAAAMLIMRLIGATPVNGLRPWTLTDRTPVFHHRWLVASPARWTAP